MSGFAAKAGKPQTAWAGVPAPHRADGPIAGPALSRPAGWRFGDIPVVPRSATPANLTVGVANDPLEHEAGQVATQVMREPRALAGVGSPQPAASSAHPAPAAVGEALASPSRPLDEGTRSFFEPRFGRDFSALRIHDGAAADRAARAVSARAFALGGDIVFGAGQYQPGTSQGRRLLAHELTHVVQQGGSAVDGVLRRDVVPAPATLKVGDDLAVSVYPLPTSTVPDRQFSRTYRIDPQGAVVLGSGADAVRIMVAGLSPAAAAQRIADGFVQAQLFRGPRVSLSGPGMTAPVWANAKTAMPPAVATAHANFMAYIRTTKEPIDAVARYYQWVSDHTDSPDFLQVSPPDLWAQSLRKPEPARDPAAEATERWLRFMRARQAEIATLPPEEQPRANETLRQFQDWLDKHHGDPDFPKADLAKIYADISVGLLKRDIEAASRKKVEADKQSAADSPELQAAKSKKFDEFLAKAMKLWGYSSHKFPYSIPLDSQGKDILVTGDPALQRVLDALASDLMRWASVHLSDSNYATVPVNRVLLNLLQGGYGEQLGEAQKQPLEHEVIDRNQFLPKSFLASMGETLATGLLAVAVVGLFVGAEVITAGQATWLLVGMAGYSGVQSYRTRRDEIERSGYDVPVPASMLHAAGDIIGVSQLIESITGQRLGADVPLGSEARSTQGGVAAGSALTMLFGSRAYRGGQRLGQSARLSLPGRVPAGPNANVPLAPAPPRPAAPQINPAIGAVEGAARAALPENLRPGLDLWSAEIRQGGANPEGVFKKIPPDRIRAQAEVWLKRYQAGVTAADRAVVQGVRATDDPLHPILRHVEPVPDSNVTLHYENKAPRPHEVAQAAEVAKRTGEAIHLFGDTASGIDYPGIDGTIGQPPRPLSLKRAVVQAHPNLARQMASDALVSAQRAGYSHVEVRIDMPGSTVAQIQTAWDLPPPLATDPIPGPAFEGDTISRIIVRGSDGEWVLRPPLAGPARTGVSPTPPRPDVPDRTKKH